MKLYQHNREYLLLLERNFSIYEESITYGKKSFYKCKESIIFILKFYEREESY